MYVLGVLRVLAGNTAETATAKRGSDLEVNELFRVHAHHERRHVDQPTSNTNVALTNQDTRVVDRTGKASVQDPGLQTTVEELLNRQVQNEIQLLLSLYTTNQTKKGVRDIVRVVQVSQIHASNIY